MSRLAPLRNSTPIHQCAMLVAGAVHDESINPATLRWLIPEDGGWSPKLLGLLGIGSGGCDGRPVCRHDFSHPGIQEIRVLARTLAGEEVSASLTLDVR